MYYYFIPNYQVFEKLGYLLRPWKSFLFSLLVGREQTTHFSMSTLWVFIPSSTKTLTWSRAKSQFHSLDLAAAFLRAVQLAGVWVSLPLSESHTAVLVCAKAELEESTCLALGWSMPIGIKVYLNHLVQAGAPA